VPTNITMQDKVKKEIENYLQVPVSDINESPLKWGGKRRNKVSTTGQNSKEVFVCVRY